MVFAQHTLGAAAASVRSVVGVDCPKLPGAVIFQMDPLAAGALYYGGDDVTAGPTNAGGFVPVDTPRVIAAVDPGTIDLDQLFIAGTVGDVVYITVL